MNISHAMSIFGEHSMPNAKFDVYVLLYLFANIANMLVKILQHVAIKCLKTIAKLS
jgi:hypothetical protein